MSYFRLFASKYNNAKNAKTRQSLTSKFSRQKSENTTEKKCDNATHFTCSFASRSFVLSSHCCVFDFSHCGIFAFLHCSVFLAFRLRMRRLITKPTRGSQRQRLNRWAHALVQVEREKAKMQQCENTEKRNCDNAKKWKCENTKGQQVWLCRIFMFLHFCLKYVVFSPFLCIFASKMWRSENTKYDVA